MLVVDDDPRVLRALTELIDATDGLRVSGSATNGSDALNVDASAPADMAVVDTLLPTMADGLALIRRLVARGCLVIATSVSGAARAPALAAGAARFVEKDSDARPLLTALSSARSL